MSLGLLGSNKSLFRDTLTGKAFLIGSLLPDVDFLLVILFRFIDRETAIEFHRSFSHTLFLPLCVLILFSIIGLRRRHLRSIGIGLSVGMALHIFSDMLLWFAPVRYLWPLNVSFGLLDSTSVSVVAWNIVFAAESLCYAIFLRLVYARTTTDFTSAAKVHSTLLVLIFLALLFPALTMHAEDFEVVAYFPALTLGFPAAIYHLCRNWIRLFDIKTWRIVV